MASTQIVRLPSVSQSRISLRPWLEKYFYFSMSLLIAVVVIYGFSHTVDQNLIHATPRRPVLLWVHALLFSSWVAFYILQTALVRSRKLKLHRTLGWAGAALGTSMVVVGFSVAVVMARFGASQLHRPQDDAYSFLIVPFLDMVTFATCLGLAILWRKTPERHRRLMLVSTCALTAAAFGRMSLMYSIPPLYFYSGVDALILLGVLRDLAISRRVHVIYLTAIPLLVAAQAAAIQIYSHKAAFWLHLTYSLFT
ncbi:MAG TPA: hypothetical protein VL156_03990 [Terriglobales bacterium]|jgi:hypothetical protein|nr:hypothetical protein [Terriglobales bacterium]